MIQLRVQREGVKRIRISGLEPYMVNCLLSLIEILEDVDVSPARDRLYPNPTRGDEKINAEWERLVTPELRHLFVSATETVARDLTGLKPDPQNASLSEIVFPTPHLNAWMCALNQARLVLAESFGVTEADMNTIDFPILDTKAIGIMKIHLLGGLLALLVELESEPEETGDGPEISL